jgi:hypothetical protein
MVPSTQSYPKMIVKKASAKKEDVPVFLMKVSTVTMLLDLFVAAADDEFGGIGEVAATGRQRPATPVPSVRVR